MAKYTDASGTYDVTVLRDAKQGDPNFDAKKDQVVIMAPGGEMVVERNEVKEKKSPEPAAKAHK